MDAPEPVYPPLDEETEKRLRSVSTATLATQLFKRGFRTRFMTGVAPLHPDMKLVGVARTLRYVPMREDLDTLDTFRNPDMPQRKAVEAVGPGEVLVIDARGDRSAGTIGNILTLRLMKRGAAGVVSDGPFRDMEEIRALRFPAYCAGAHAATNLTVHHPVDIDLPIGCGGVMVEPGDVIVGDGDGVIVIPRHLAVAVSADAADQELAEQFVLEKIQRGASIVGVYPMGDDAQKEYSRWKSRKRKK